MKWVKTERPSDMDDFIEYIENLYEFDQLPLISKYEVLRVRRFDGIFIIYQNEKGRLSWDPTLRQIYRQWKAEQ